MGLDAGLFHPCFFAFFSDLYYFLFLIFSNIILHTVSVIYIRIFTMSMCSLQW